MIYREFASFRFAVLGFICIINFCCHLSYEIPITMAHSISKFIPKDVDTELVLDVDKYIQWIGCLIAGFLIDKYKNISKILYAYLLLCFIGSVCYGVFFVCEIEEEAMYVLLIISRGLIGFGMSGVLVIVNCIISRWFTGKELGMAFATQLASARLGTMTNLYITDIVYDFVIDIYPSYVVPITLSMGPILIMATLFISYLYNNIDNRAMNSEIRMFELVHGNNLQLNSDDIDHNNNNNNNNVFGILKFNKSFWILCMIICTYSGIILSFMGIAYKIETTSHRFIHLDSHRLISAYLFIILVSPLLGLIIDHIGHRSKFILLGMCLVTPAIIILQHPSYKIDPLTPIMMFSASYTMFICCTWTSVQMFIPVDKMGIGNGIVYFFTHLSILVLSIDVENIIETKEYTLFLRQELVISIITLFFCVLLIASDYSLSVLKVGTVPYNNMHSNQYNNSDFGRHLLISYNDEFEHNHNDNHHHIISGIGIN